MPFSAILKAKVTGRATFHPRSSSIVGAVTKYFESATLESARITVSVSGGSGVTACVGVGTGTIPAGPDGFLALPQCVIFTGSADGLGTGEYVLPPDHSFGREIKAAALGNPDPSFFFCIDAPDSGVAMIRGVITIRVSGAGVPVPFSLTSVK
jgi:hypothetical protein